MWKRDANDQPFTDDVRLYYYGLLTLKRGIDFSRQNLTSKVDPGTGRVLDIYSVRGSITYVFK